MHPPGLLFAHPLPLSQQLKSRVDHRLAHILRSNYKTQFARVASELNTFRDVVAVLVDDMDDATLCETFRKTVQLTTYDAYFPLISKLFKSPCRESEVVDLLAPGLPDYITMSSSTSGGAPKAFPKYNWPLNYDAPAAVRFPAPSNPPKRTTAFMFAFMREPLDIIDENDRLVKMVNVTFTNPSLVWRSALDLHPENDEEKMATFLSDFAAPYAAGFVNKWNSFLIIHGLFALGSRSLEHMNMSFVTTFVELIRYIDVQFDMITDCIANGTIPDLDGTAHVRHHLESAISPNPERAAELRNIGRPSSRPGWCHLAWPNLRSVTCTSSGSFGSSLPLARSFLGPNVNMLARGYGCSESRIAMPYNLFYLEHYKFYNDILIEFLDFDKNESLSAIVQPWEVDVRKRYEVVLTTSNGLWRYRLGDVVEIAGFDPNNGMPVIQFIERRSAAIRFAHVMISETELTSAMMSVAESMLGDVVEWTATLDERHLPRRIGFFVELAGEQACDASLAGERLLDALSRSNDNVARAFVKRSLGKPTVWIVGRGTFSAFRQLKLDESNNMGQVKVPVVLPKPAHVTWFLERVVKEL